MLLFSNAPPLHWLSFMKLGGVGLPPHHLGTTISAISIYSVPSLFYGSNPLVFFLNQGQGYLQSRQWIICGGRIQQFQPSAHCL